MVNFNLTKSKKFIVLLGSFLIGIFVSKDLSVSWTALFFASGCFVLLSILYFRTKLLFVSLSFLFLFLGTSYYGFYNQNFKPNITLGTREITGVISDEPIVKSQNQNFTIRTDQGKILIYSRQYPEYKYGDRLKIVGDIKQPTNYDSFDYNAYLTRYGIGAISYYPNIEKIDSNQGNGFTAQIYKIKNKFIESISRSMPEPESSLSSAILVGARKTLPQDLIDIFKKTGLTHIIAISGFNVTILISVIWMFSRQAGRKMSLLISLLFATGFVVLTGASSSVVRGAIVSTLIILSKYFGRRSSGIALILLSAALMSLANVYVLRIDAGFQLSFLAFTGLIYLSPILSKKIDPLRAPGFFKGAFCETVSAQIFALPLLLVLFGNISLISVLANILILPVIPFAMLVGFLQGILGMIYLPIAQFFGWVNWFILHYVISLSNFFAHLPFSNLEIKITSIWLVLYYPILIYIIWLKSKKTIYEKD